MILLICRGSAFFQGEPAVGPKIYSIGDENSENEKGRSICYCRGIIFSGATCFLPVERVHGAEPDGWINIGSAEQLAGIKDNPTANYRLVSDIDLEGNWTPLGAFEGKLDGNGRRIRNLSISNTTFASAGLFSSIEEEAQISDLGFEGAGITAGNNSGILAGINKGCVSRVYAKGSVSGQNSVGGLVGENAVGAEIIDSFVNASVSGRDYMGGLAGTNSGDISRSYSSSQVKGSVFNNYLAFNGTTGYIRIPHHADYVTGTFTLEAWFQWDDVVKPEGTDPHAYVDFIIGKGVEQ